jgi:uncharacterized membrane protein YfcA
MIILMGAAILGAVLGAMLNSKADALTLVLSIPVGGSLFASAAAILLFISRSRSKGKYPDNRLPPTGWSGAETKTQPDCAPAKDRRGASSAFPLRLVAGFRRQDSDEEPSPCSRWREASGILSQAVGTL